jgi:biopolymer transport protein ExbD
MKNNRRMKRMAGSRKKTTALNLTSLMDVFTILVFFLLFNSSSGEVLEAPKEIKLPDSIVESKPRETVVIMVTPDMVLVQGHVVAKTAELLKVGNETVVQGVAEELRQLDRRIIGISTKGVVDSKEVTILADRTIPFTILKKIMSSCTSVGYGKISLAVIQKAARS